MLQFIYGIISSEEAVIISRQILPCRIFAVNAVPIGINCQKGQCGYESRASADTPMDTDNSAFISG